MKVMKSWSVEIRHDGRIYTEDVRIVAGTMEAAKNKATQYAKEQKFVKPKVVGVRLDREPLVV